MFIGEKKIVLTIEQEDNKLKIECEDGYIMLINKDLYNFIATEEVGKGTISDQINHYFAKKFVSELAFYDLNFYFSDSVGISMGTLTHNLREELIRKTFDCAGADEIPLKKFF